MSIAVLSLLLLPSCVLGGSPCEPGFALDDDDRCVFDEPTLLALVADMDGGELQKINAEPYMPPYSANPIRRNVWVSPVPLPDDPELDAAEVYAAIDQDDWSTPLPEALPFGTVIIHEAVDREEAHGVAVKRDDYVNDWGTNWWFQMIDDGGNYDTEGREPCTNCHSECTRPTEGLWGVPTAAKASE